jgi:flavorubredoxin
MTTLTEITQDLYRISTYVPESHLQFNQFLVKDDEPLLYHTGHGKMFPAVREAVAKVIDPSQLRWIAFSHFESDECGALGSWLETAPKAEPVCSVVGARVNVNNFFSRPARAMKHNEVLTTGRHRFRFHSTPHVPHCWEAGHLFDETSETLLCSDLFHQNGEVEPVTERDVVERARQALVEYQAGPLAYYMPFTPLTERCILGLAELKPKRCATMHGSTFIGDGQRALRELAKMMSETLQQPQFLKLPE